MNLNEQIETIEIIIEDTKYSLSKSRSPASKRNYKKSISLWNDILKSLNELKSLKQ